MSVDRGNLTKAEILTLLEAADAELTDFRQVHDKAGGDVDWESLQNHTKAQMVNILKAWFAHQDLTVRRRLRVAAASNLHLMGGRSYEEEMGVLHTQIADLERRLETALGRIRSLEGTDVAAYSRRAFS